MEIASYISSKEQRKPSSVSNKIRQSGFFQPKLTINQPNDIYEQEADAVADKVMRMPEKNSNPLFFQPKPVPISAVQRKCDDCEHEDDLQRKEDDEDNRSIQMKDSKVFDIHRKCDACEKEEKVQMKGEAIASGGMIAPSAVSNAITSGGQPLDRNTKSFMESRFGYDFSSVQIHNDSLAHQSSKEINALAYTHGNHIVFGLGQYQPDTNSGRGLLAHELAHVVQQRSMRSKPIQQKVIDDDEHVTCRFGREGAVAALMAAEGEAARLADNAALALRRNPISETTRTSLWKQFKMDYNEQAIRCRIVPAIAQRFEVVADGIRSRDITYKCTDYIEPHAGCDNVPKPLAITPSGLTRADDIFLCLWFWQKDIDKAVVLLHEWVHVMYEYQGTGDKLPGGFNTAGCYHAFAIDVNNRAATGREERNCTPRLTPVPSLKKAAVENLPCPANLSLSFSAISGPSSLLSRDYSLATEVGLDYVRPLGRRRELELALGGRLSYIKPSRPEDQAAVAVGARIGLTYLRTPWDFGVQGGLYAEGGVINASDPTGTGSTVPYVGGGGTLGVHIPLDDQSSMRIFLEAGYRQGVDTGDPEQLKWLHYGFGIALETR